MQNSTPDNIEKIECFYKSEYPALLRYAKRVLQNDGLAEDAVQDTFQIALLRADKLLQSQNPVGWLYETLKNVMMHVLRDRQKYLKYVVPEEIAPKDKLAAPDITPSLAALYGDSDEMKLLIMFYGCGYSVRELAAMLGISEAACKMRLRRARKNQQGKIDI